MKRDMNLVLKILQKIEDKTSLTSERIEIEGEDEQVVTRHIEMMQAAGLLDGLPPKRERGGITMYVKDLSWEGHDFLVAIQDKGVWSRLTEEYSVDQLAKMPLAILKLAAVGLLKDAVERRLGLK